MQREINGMSWIMRLSLSRGCSAQLKLDARGLRELNGFENYWNHLLQDDWKLLSIKQGWYKDEREFLNPVTKYNPIFWPESILFIENRLDLSRVQIGVQWNFWFPQIRKSRTVEGKKFIRFFCEKLGLEPTTHTFLPLQLPDRRSGCYFYLTKSGRLWAFLGATHNPVQPQH